MRTSVLDVARYILDTRDGRPLDTMKLQKLAYYCQAWHFTWTFEPLFAEQFEAWANGPVCRVLFVQHRKRYAVTATDMPGDPAAIAPSSKKIIDRVVESYMPLSGMTLSALTHSEDPWVEARGALPENARSNAPITLHAMAAFYGSLGDEDPLVDPADEEPAI